MDPSPQQTFLYYIYNIHENSKYLQIDDKYYVRTDALPIENDDQKAINLFYTYVLSPIVQEFMDRSDNTFFKNHMKFSGLLSNSVQISEQINEKHQNQPFDWEFFSLLYNDQEAQQNFIDFIQNTFEQIQPFFIELVQSFLGAENDMIVKLQDMSTILNNTKNGFLNQLELKNLVQNFFGLILNDDFLQLVMRNDQDFVQQFLNKTNIQKAIEFIQQLGYQNLGSKIAIYLFKSSILDQVSRMNSKTLVNLGFYLYLLDILDNQEYRQLISKNVKMNIKQVYSFDIKDGKGKSLQQTLDVLSDYILEKIKDQNIEILKKQNKYLFQNNKFSILTADPNNVNKQPKNIEEIWYIHNLRNEYHASQGHVDTINGNGDTAKQKNEALQQRNREKIGALYGYTVQNIDIYEAEKIDLQVKLEEKQVKATSKQLNTILYKQSSSQQKLYNKYFAYDQSVEIEEYIKHIHKKMQKHQDNQTIIYKLQNLGFELIQFISDNICDHGLVVNILQAAVQKNISKFISLVICENIQLIDSIEYKTFYNSELLQHNKIHFILDQFFSLDSSDNDVQKQIINPLMDTVCQEEYTISNIQLNQMQFENSDKSKSLGSSVLDYTKNMYQPGAFGVPKANKKQKNLSKYDETQQKINMYLGKLMISVKFLNKQYQQRLTKKQHEQQYQVYKIYKKKLNQIINNVQVLEWCFIKIKKQLYQQESSSYTKDYYINDIPEQSGFLDKNRQDFNIQQLSAFTEMYNLCMNSNIQYISYIGQQYQSVKLFDVNGGNLVNNTAWQSNLSKIFAKGYAKDALKQGNPKQFLAQLQNWKPLVSNQQKEFEIKIYNEQEYVIAIQNNVNSSDKIHRIELFRQEIIDDNLVIDNNAIFDKIKIVVNDNVLILDHQEIKKSGNLKIDEIIKQQLQGYSNKQIQLDLKIQVPKFFTVMSSGIILQCINYYMQNLIEFKEVLANIQNVQELYIMSGNLSLMQILQQLLFRTFLNNYMLYNMRQFSIYNENRTMQVYLRMMLDQYKSQDYTNLLYNIKEHIQILQRISQPYCLNENDYECAFKHSDLGLLNSMFTREFQNRKIPVNKSEKFLEIPLLPDQIVRNQTKLNDALNSNQLIIDFIKKNGLYIQNKCKKIKQIIQETLDTILQNFDVSGKKGKEGLSQMQKLAGILGTAGGEWKPLRLHINEKEEYILNGLLDQNANKGNPQNNYTANDLIANSGKVFPFYINRILGKINKLLTDDNTFNKTGPLKDLELKMEKLQKMNSSDVYSFEFYKQIDEHLNDIIQLLNDSLITIDVKQQICRKTISALSNYRSDDDDINRELDNRLRSGLADIARSTDMVQRNLYDLKQQLNTVNFKEQIQQLKNISQKGVLLTQMQSFGTIFQVQQFYDVYGEDDTKPIHRILDLYTHDCQYQKTGIWLKIPQIVFPNSNVQMLYSFTQRNTFNNYILDNHPFFYYLQIIISEYYVLYYKTGQEIGTGNLDKLSTLRQLFTIDNPKSQETYDIIVEALEQNINKPGAIKLLQFLQKDQKLKNILNKQKLVDKKIFPEYKMTNAIGDQDENDILNVITDSFIAATRDEIYEFFYRQIEKDDTDEKYRVVSDNQYNRNKLDPNLYQFTDKIVFSNFSFNMGIEDNESENYNSFLFINSLDNIMNSIISVANDNLRTLFPDQSAVTDYDDNGDRSKVNLVQRRAYYDMQPIINDINTDTSIGEAQSIQKALYMLQTNIEHVPWLTYNIPHMIISKDHNFINTGNLFDANIANANNVTQETIFRNCMYQLNNENILLKMYLQGEFLMLNKVFILSKSLQGQLQQEQEKDYNKVLMQTLRICQYIQLRRIVPENLLAVCYHMHERLKKNIFKINNYFNLLIYFIVCKQCGLNPVFDRTIKYPVDAFNMDFYIQKEQLKNFIDLLNCDNYEDHKNIEKREILNIKIDFSTIQQRQLQEKLVQIFDQLYYLMNEGQSFNNQIIQIINKYLFGQVDTGIQKNYTQSANHNLLLKNLKQRQLNFIYLKNHRQYDLQQIFSFEELKQVRYNAGGNPTGIVAKNKQRDDIIRDTKLFNLYNPDLIQIVQVPFGPIADPDIPTPIQKELGIQNAGIVCQLFTFQLNNKNYFDFLEIDDLFQLSPDRVQDFDTYNSSLQISKNYKMMDKIDSLKYFANQYNQYPIVYAISNLPNYTQSLFRKNNKTKTGILFGILGGISSNYNYNNPQDIKDNEILQYIDFKNIIKKSRQVPNQASNDQIQGIYWVTRTLSYSAIGQENKAVSKTLSTEQKKYISIHIKQHNKYQDPQSLDYLESRISNIEDIQNNINDVETMIISHKPWPKLSRDDIDSKCYKHHLESQFQQIPTGQGKSSALLPYFSSLQREDTMILTMDNLVEQNVEDFNLNMLGNTSQLVTINDKNMMLMLSRKNRFLKDQHETYSSYIHCIHDSTNKNQGKLEADYPLDERRRLTRNAQIEVFKKCQEQMIHVDIGGGSNEYIFKFPKKFIFICGYKQYLKFLFQEYRDELMVQYDYIIQERNLNWKEQLMLNGEQMLMQNNKYLEQMSLKDKNKNIFDDLFEKVIMYRKIDKKYCYLLDEFHSIFSNDTIYKYIEQSEDSSKEISNLESEFEKIKRAIVYDPKENSFSIDGDKWETWMKDIPEFKRIQIEKQLKSYNKMQLNINLGIHDLIQKENQCPDDDTFDDLQSLILARPLNQGIIQCKSFFDSYLSQTIFSYLMYIQFAYKSYQKLRDLDIMEINNLLQTKRIPELNEQDRKINAEEYNKVYGLVQLIVETGFNNLPDESKLLLLPYYQLKFEYMLEDKFAADFDQQLKQRIETQIRLLVQKKQRDLDAEYRNFNEKHIKLSALVVAVIGEQLFGNIKEQLNKVKAVIPLEQICKLITKDLNKSIPCKGSKVYEVNQYDLLLHINQSSYLQYAVSGTTTTAVYDINEIIRDISPYYQTTDANHENQNLYFIGNEPIIEGALHGDMDKRQLINVYQGSKFQQVADIDNSLLKKKLMNNVIKNKIKYTRMDEKELDNIVDKYFADYPHMTYFEKIDDHLDELFGLNGTQFTQLINKYHEQCLQLDPLNAQSTGFRLDQTNVGIAAKNKYQAILNYPIGTSIITYMGRNAGIGIGTQTDNNRINNGTDIIGSADPRNQYIKQNVDQLSSAGKALYSFDPQPQRYTQVFHLLPDQNGLLQNIENVQDSLNGLDQQAKDYFKVVIIYESKADNNFDMYFNIGGKYLNKEQLRNCILKANYHNNDVPDPVYSINDLLVDLQKNSRNMQKLYNLFKFRNPNHDYKENGNNDVNILNPIILRNQGVNQSFQNTHFLMVFKMSRTTGFDVQNQQNYTHSVCSIINTNKNLHNKTNIKSWLQGVGRCRTLDCFTPIFVYLYKDQEKNIEEQDITIDENQLYISNDFKNRFFNYQSFGKDFVLRLAFAQNKGQLFSSNQLLQILKCDQQQLAAQIAASRLQPISTANSTQLYLFVGANDGSNKIVINPKQLIDSYVQRVKFYKYLCRNELVYNNNPIHYQLFSKAILKGDFRLKENIEFTDYNYYNNMGWKDTRENMMKFSVLGKNFQERSSIYSNIRFWSNKWTGSYKDEDDLMLVQQMQMQQSQQQIQQMQQQMLQRQQQQQLQLQQVMMELFNEQYQYDYDSSMLRYFIMLYQGLNTNYQYLYNGSEESKKLLPLFKRTIIRAYQDQEDFDLTLDAINIYEKIIKLLSREEYGVEISIDKDKMIEQLQNLKQERSEQLQQQQKKGKKKIGGKYNK